MKSETSLIFLPSLSTNLHFHGEIGIQVYPNLHKITISYIDKCKLIINKKNMISIQKYEKKNVVLTTSADTMVFMTD